MLRQNRRERNRLEGELERLEEQEKTRRSDTSRNMCNLQHELVQMRAMGALYREYSLANLTTKKRLDQSSKSLADLPLMSRSQGHSLPQVPETGLLSLHRKEPDKRVRVRKVTLITKRNHPHGLFSQGPQNEGPRNITHVTSFYGFHSVAKEPEERLEPQPEINRENTEMFIKRRSALLPANINTAYMFRKFMMEKANKVLKEATPEKLRQQKVQRLVPTVKFPDIIQRQKTFSAIVRDHQRYREERGPSRDGTYGQLASCRLPGLRKYNSSPELKQRTVRIAEQEEFIPPYQESHLYNDMPEQNALGSVTDNVT